MKPAVWQTAAIRPRPAATTRRCAVFGEKTLPILDAAQWRYCYELFERAANVLLKMVPNRASLEGLDTGFFDHVDDYLSPKQLLSHPVVACFSKQPDVLSQ